MLFFSGRWCIHSFEYPLNQVFYSVFVPLKEKNTCIHYVFAASTTEIVQNTANYAVFRPELRKHWFLQCFFGIDLEMCRNYIAVFSSLLSPPVFKAN